MKHSAKGAARQARAEQALARHGPDTGDGSSRRWLIQLPYWLVVAGVVAGLATVRSGGQAVRGGSLVIAGALLAGALARLVLPDSKAGMLGSRRRLFDVAALAALGAGLLIAGVFARIPG